MAAVAETTGTGTRKISLDELIGRIDGMSTLPQVAMSVIKIASDPDAGAADLKRVVEGDPALSVRVIRIVNSASCGVRTEVNNLHQAISLLGFSTVRNLALTASVSTLFQNDRPIGTYRRTDLWRHMVSVGICARLVAIRRKLANFEDAFLAGLLHDIGIVLEDEYVHEPFCKVIQALNESRTLPEVEQEILGFSHANLGERVAESWKFPPLVRAAIRYHHASTNYKGSDAEIVRCVEIANVVCTLKGITSVGRKVMRPAPDVFQAMNYQKQDLVVLATDLDREIRMNENLFEL
jgi:putative nucleotidyltransferase with HDIG domain